MYQRVIKRVADFLISLVLVVLLFIPGLIVALVIKLDSKGPVFFKQTRYTKDTRPFTMIKFRTMVTDAPIQAAGQIQNPKQYITKFGRILRETSIDELPQLLNVLKGDMSIVGPRALGATDAETLRLRKEKNADSVYAGITGLAQIYGRNNIDNPNIKTNYDAAYAENVNFVDDVKIMIKTIRVVLKGDGIYSSNND